MGVRVLAAEAEHWCRVSDHSTLPTDELYLQFPCFLSVYLTCPDRALHSLRNMAKLPLRLTDQMLRQKCVMGSNA
jgi:hypothetical protein